MNDAIIHQVCQLVIKRRHALHNFIHFTAYF